MGESVKEILTNKNCTDASRLSFYYGTFIEQNNWNVTRLYEDLLQSQSNFMIHMIEQTNMTRSTQLCLKAILMQCIETLNPEIERIIGMEQTKLLNDRRAQEQRTELLTNYLNAYETITISSALVFTAGVTLASQYLSEDNFQQDTIVIIFGEPVLIFEYIFHTLISVSIMFSLYGMVVTSWIVYNIYHALAKDNVELAYRFLGSTHGKRERVRMTFVSGLVFFALSVTALYFEGLPVFVAVINAMIFAIGLFVISGDIFGKN